MGPVDARIMATPKLWLEGEAVRQFQRVAGHEKVRAAVGMPDLHPGKGVPVGAAFVLQDAVWPELIGEDIGCGMRVYKTDLLLRKLKLEAFARQLENRFLADEHRPGLVFRDVWAHGSDGIRDEHVREFLAGSGEPAGVHEPVPTPPRAWASCVAALGTIGRGNHFVEIQAVEEICDPVAAEEFGVAKHDVLVAIHSGSRSVGAAVRNFTLRELGNGIIEGETVQQWLGLMNGTLNVARCNRALLALRVAGSMKKCGWTFLCDTHHNYVAVEDQVGTTFPGCSSPLNGSKERASRIAYPTDARSAASANVYVHRKGALRAGAGELFLLPGSRGDYSYLMQGTGNEEWLCTVAHGAGRKMARQEAAAKMKLKYKRAELHRTSLGSHVICDDNKLLYEEAPEAYKNVDSVRECLEVNDAAKAVARLRPLVTVKC